MKSKKLKRKSIEYKTFQYLRSKYSEICFLYTDKDIKLNNEDFEEYRDMPNFTLLAARKGYFGMNIFIKNEGEELNEKEFHIKRTLELENFYVIESDSLLDVENAIDRYLSF